MHFKAEVTVESTYTFPGAPAKAGNSYQHAFLIGDTSGVFVGGPPLEVAEWDATDWARLVWGGRGAITFTGVSGGNSHGLANGYVPEYQMTHLKVSPAFKATGPSWEFIPGSQDQALQAGKRVLPDLNSQAGLPAPLMVNTEKRTNVKKRHGMFQFPAYYPADVHFDGTTPTPIVFPHGLFTTWAQDLLDARIPMVIKAKATTTASVVTHFKAQPRIGVRRSRIAGY
jgi:hypothetical protein